MPFGLHREQVPSTRFDRVVAALPIEHDRRVLEIGCGHGVALTLVAERLTTGTIVGIDRSAKMTALARTRNAAAIRAGRVEVRTGQLATVELGPGPYDLAFAVNVGHFASADEPELARLAEHLTGPLHLFYEPPPGVTPTSFARAAEERLRTSFEVRVSLTARGAHLVAAPREQVTR